MAEFGCDEVTATATTGIFLIGMGIGAIPFAPLSERELPRMDTMQSKRRESLTVRIVYGRLPVYIGTIFLATILEIACAVAPSASALIILRLFAGLVSSAPLSNAGGTLFDIGDSLSRTVQFPIFTACGFVAPILAPILGGYVVNTPSLGWRWMFWLTAIWNGLAFLLVLCCMPETLAAGLLQLKARKLRLVTRNGCWRSKAEDQKFWPALSISLRRPLRMITAEPVLQLFCVYLTGMSVRSLMRPIQYTYSRF